MSQEAVVSDEIRAEIQRSAEEIRKRDAKANPEAFKYQAVDVVRQGKQIILPDGMTHQEAIECIKRKQKEEEEVVAIHEEVVAHPLDGAYALMQVLAAIFGWAHAAPTPGFFGPNPPVFANLEVGYKRSVQVIWGGFTIPGVEGQLQTSASRKNGQVVFCIAGKVKQKHRHIVKTVADQVRVFVRNNSVYKGQAVRLLTNEKGELQFDFEYQPQFMDLSTVNEKELVFSEELMAQVETSVFTPIEKTEECRKFGIPLKRGILFEGKYGTGKTLTANVTAKKCVENGWTFLYLDRVTALKDVLLFARQYAPAVVFAEDLDRVVSGERDVKVDDVLNNIDGVDSKNQEIMVILTTNRVEAIEPAMLRPGRLDAVITVSPPDSVAAAKLIRLYARGLVDENEDLKEPGLELQGQIPAVIREVVERSKLAAITRMKPGEELQLRSSDILLAAKSMKNHLELMRPEEKSEPSAEEKVGSAIAEIVRKAQTPESKSITRTEQITEAVAQRLGVGV